MIDVEGLLVVVRQGVYDQGVVGIAQTIDEAKAIAEGFAEKERDTYHAFVVRRRDPETGEFEREMAWFRSPEWGEPRTWEGEKG